MARPGGTRPESATSSASVTPSRILHDVVRLTFARAPEVVDLDGIRVQQLAGELDLALEAVNELVGGNVLLQDLDRGRTLEQRMAREIDRRHAALAHLLDQRVRTEPLHASELPAQACQQERRHERRHQRQSDNATDDREADRQITQCREGFVGRHLGNNTEVVGRQPLPGTDDRRATIALVGRRDHAPAIDVGTLATSANGPRRGLRQRACRRQALCRRSCRQFTAGVTYMNSRGVFGPGRRRLHLEGQCLGLTTRGEHESIITEGIGFPGVARPRGAKDGLEFAIGGHSHRKGGYRRSRADAYRRQEPGHRTQRAIGTTYG